MKFFIPKSVKLLSLDAMNTLIRLKEPPGVVYSRFARDYGIKADPQLLTSRFRQSFKNLEQSHPCYGIESIGVVKWWGKVIKGCFGEDLKFSNDAVFDEMCVQIYDYYSTKEPWMLLEHDVLQQLDRLRSLDLAVSITSNFDSRLRSVLLEFGILNHVDFIALSGEIGASKPDPRVFEVLMDFFNLAKPDEILHVGDSVENDVEGGSDFGAHVCLLGPSKEEGKEKVLKNVPVIQGLGDLAV